jgi:Protein of unknown function (DUF4446)
MVDELNRIVADNLALVAAVLAVGFLIVLVAVTIQSARLGRAVKAYRALTRGAAAAGTLEEVLDTHVGRVEAVAGRLDDLDRLHADFEQRSQTAIQHIGLVRFNPFDDTGSDQSFALALLDDNRDGIVVSSLHGRQNTRIFAKPVQGGTSRHALSTEESQAIEVAVSGTGARQPADA